VEPFWADDLRPSGEAPAWQPPARTPLARSKPRAPSPSGVVFAGAVNNRQIKKIPREDAPRLFVSLAPSRTAGGSVRLASRVLIISRSRSFYKEIVRMTLRLSQFGTNGSRWHEMDCSPSLIGAIRGGVFFCCLCWPATSLWQLSPGSSLGSLHGSTVSFVRRIAIRQRDSNQIGNLISSEAVDNGRNTCKRTKIRAPQNHRRRNCEYQS
jgi:hypothetical protein